MLYSIGQPLCLSASQRGAERVIIGHQRFIRQHVADIGCYDQIQTLVDPDYRGSFRGMEQRVKKETGQEFWFRPGSTSPARAPNLPNALGRN